MAMASWIAKRPKHSGVREKFDPYIEIPHGQSGAGTNMRGSCKSCRQEISPTLARMAPHFLKKKGHVAVCTAKDLPEASVLAAKAYFDTVSLTNEGALTKRATDAAFSQQAIPSSLRGVSRRKHNTLLQSSYEERVVCWENAAYAEHRTTIADGRLDDAYAKIGVEMKTVMEGEEMRRLDHTWSTDGWKGRQKKHMQFLLGMIQLCLNHHAKFIVANDAWTGLLHLLEGRYPGITGVKCVAHSIDLAIKGICKQDWAAELVKFLREAVKFLKRHQKLLAIVKKKNPTRGLLLPNDPRFGTSVIMTNRFLGMKSALETLVVDEECRAYLDASSVKVATRNLGKRIRDLTFNGEMEEGACWFEVEFFLVARMPFFELVLLVDGIKPQAA
eukprot:jgi/Undpi1/12367/HiC_scaffold_5.g02039.m1